MSNQKGTSPIDFHEMGWGTVMRPINCLVTDILQNIFFCLQQKKYIIHIRFEQHEGE